MRVHRETVPLNLLQNVYKWLKNKSCLRPTIREAEQYVYFVVGAEQLCQLAEYMEAPDAQTLRTYIQYACYEICHGGTCNLLRCILGPRRLDTCRAKPVVSHPGAKTPLALE